MYIYLVGNTGYEIKPRAFYSKECAKKWIDTQEYKEDFYITAIEMEGEID